MKHKVYIAAIMLGALCTTIVVGAPRQLLPGERINSGLLPICVDAGQAAPEVADWNNDGRKDLLVGQFMDGKIALFLNQGSSARPAFKGSTFIQSGGVDITTAFG